MFGALKPGFRSMATLKLVMNQWRIQKLTLGGAHERAEREPITGVWGRIPQRGPGAEPLVRGLGSEAESL